MSNKNTFDGLQFRILETLEKQPNHAPLMAIEIAERLHDTEYRHEMKDNVVFKVTRAVHAMREKGKIAVAEARGPNGQLCYVLPQRLKFPKPNGGPPLNPVLQPEQAAQIKTVEPTPVSRHKIYVPGVQEMVFEVVDKSPYPVTSQDVVDKIGPHYHHITQDKERIRQLIAGHLNHLLKTTRKIYARPSTVKGMRYEYFTRQTGTLPNPLAGTKGESHKAKPVVETQVTTPAPVPAPAPSAPAAASPGLSDRALFRPGVRQPPQRVQFNMDITVEQRDAWKAAADRFGIPVVQLVIEAMEYALEHAERV